MDKSHKKKIHFEMNWDYGNIDPENSLWAIGINKNKQEYDLKCYTSKSMQMASGTEHMPLAYIYILYEAPSFTNHP